jgi:hypothetical protein
VRPRHAALALLTALLVSPALAGPAAAGGPTSVLLVVPGEGRTASLYTGQADYETLAELVGAFGDPGATGSTDGIDHATGSQVTVTWLIHDASVWRVDRIYPEAPGGPWIATQTSLDGSADIWSGPVRWHHATQGTSLVAVLSRLGLLDGAAAAAPADRSTASDGQSGPVWGAVGLALGVALTVVARRLAGRRDDEPELVTSRSSDDVLTSTGATLRR